ncbi:MAG: type II secretion system GspH family protein [Lachnospiraceae bacterium]|nr:type II secretion system GspH family protein [Lachnospiraceae bacterium]
MFIKNKKGFTLVELMIAMGMFAVVSSAIMVFMVTGTTNFRKNRNNAEIQKNAQLTVMQLTTFTQEALYADYDGTNLTFYTPKYFAPDAVLTDDQKYGHKDALTKKVVAYDSTDKCLYFKEYDNINASVADLLGSNKKDYLMTDCVVDFDVDTSNLDVNNTITITLGMKKEALSYNLTQVLKLRNAASAPVTGSALGI